MHDIGFLFTIIDAHSTLENAHLVQCLAVLLPTATAVGMVAVPRLHHFGALWCPS